MGQIGRNLVVPIKLRIPEATAWQLDYGGEAPSVERETAHDPNLRSLNLRSVHTKEVQFLRQ